MDLLLSCQIFKLITKIEKMKTININTIIAIVLFTMVTLLFSSCKKECEISEEEAANLIAIALSSTSNGLNYRITIEDSLLASDSIACGETKTYSTNIMNPVGSNRNYSYSNNISHTLICSGTQEFTTALAASGSYNGPIISASDNITGTWRLSGFEDTNDTIRINGNYRRTGNARITIFRTKQITYDLNAVTSNLSYSKLTHKITGGNAGIVINGNTTYYGVYNYTANIRFLGNDLAEVNINGKIFTINLITGQIV